MANLDFEYNQTTTVNRDGGRWPSVPNEDGGENYNPYLRYTLHPAGTVLLVLNGEQPNLKAADMSVSGAPLQSFSIRPPSGQLFPMLSEPGDGKIFGAGYKWRHRFKNALTNEVSGMSELPDEGLNLGLPTKEGGEDYIGQRAYFYLQGTSAVGVSHLQVLRNTDSQDVWFVIDEKANPGAGSYVLFEDNLTDTEIGDNENHLLKPNPTYDEGPVPPVCKALQHSTGRTWLYGILRMSPYRVGTATYAKDGSTVTLSGTAVLVPGRVGQRFRPLQDSSTDIDDENVYRIVEVLTTSTFNVFPALKEARTAVTYEIIDDRDARAIWQSSPNFPTQVDPLQTLLVGKSKDDPLMHVWMQGGTTYAATRQRIYVFSYDYSEDPVNTHRLSVVVEEGMSGFWAGASTPFGFVYFNTQTGVRLFDGRSSTLPLGSQSPFEDFLLETQRDTVAASALDEVRVFYDPRRHRVYVSFPSSTRLYHEQTWCFDPSTGIWRGPWRVRLSTSGFLRDSCGEDTFLFGDDFGNLNVPDEQVLDVVNTEAAALTLTGGVTTVSSTKVFIDSAAGFGSAGELVGCPISFYDSNGLYIESNWVAGVVSTTSLELLHIPSTALATSQTYEIGTINWNLDTAYIDGGEPIHTKRFRSTNLRFERGGTDSFNVQGERDGNGTFTDAEGSPLDLSSDPEKNFFAAKMKIAEARSFVLRLKGDARNGEPKITGVQADLVAGTGRE